MTAFRIIPCLDVHGGGVVKGVNFRNLRAVGDPVELARRYRDEGADELVFLDVSATVEERAALHRVIDSVARVLDIPFTVGGGVRSLEDAAALLAAGADKVAVNSAAVSDPSLLGRLAARFGTQCVVLAIDAGRVEGRCEGRGERGERTGSSQPASGDSGPGTRDSGLETWWEVVTHGGRRPTGIDAVTWARDGVSRGAGEILLTSMDRDGTLAGFDLDLVAAVRAVVDVPLIASGGGESAAHFAAAARAGADAGLAATIFHEARTTIGALKDQLAAAGIAVRREDS
ncbi:MAG: imidazole glycerol phosphate synthase subunit HisF [Acidobacteria bacterium]|nr:imidazole glycerol phosphate synthase subunit HisF [Acidobacteriota bacterium]